MMFIYVQNVKHPEVRYEVLEYDAATKIAKLKGAIGTVFSRNISKPEMDKYGYTIVKSETALPLTNPPAGKK